MTSFPGLTRQAWPRDPEELDSYYGDPRGANGQADPVWESANLTTFTFPWHEKGAQTYRIHKKVLPSLMRVLNAIWDHVGRDQTQITFYHLDETGGTYNFRANRNNPKVLSNHSRGIAIDLAPDENPNRSAWVDQAPPHLPRFVIEAFKQEGWRWGGDYSVTKDAMHFEAVWDKHHDEQPVPAPPDSPTVAAPAPSIVMPQVPILMPNDGDPIGGLIRQWMLAKTGLPDEVDTVRAQALATLAVARAQIEEAISILQGFSFSPVAPVAPAAPPMKTVPSPAAPAAPAPAALVKYTNIHATCFGGSQDPNHSAYDNHLINDQELGVSLPYRLKKQRFICVELNGVVKTGATVDVGPWNTKDSKYALTPGSRPLVETQYANHTKAQNGEVPTNVAGIDLTPAMVVALGGAPDAIRASKWSGTVNWWYANVDDLKQEMPMNPITTSPVTSTLGGGAIIAAGSDLLMNWSTKNWGGVLSNLAVILAGVGGLFAQDGHK